MRAIRLPPTRNYYTHFYFVTAANTLSWHHGIGWDEDKPERTLSERGLDDEALTVEDLRKEYGERRFVSLVPIKDRLCVVAWGIRGTTLRVISLRKANGRERKRYEQG